MRQRAGLAELAPPQPPAAGFNPNVLGRDLCVSTRREILRFAIVPRDAGLEPRLFARLQAGLEDLDRCVVGVIIEEDHRIAVGTGSIVHHPMQARVIKAIGPIDHEVAEVHDKRAWDGIDPDPISRSSLDLKAALVILRKEGDPPPVGMGTGAKLIEFRVRRMWRISQQAQRGLLVIEGMIEKSVRHAERECDEARHMPAQVAYLLVIVFKTLPKARQVVGPDVRHMVRSSWLGRGRKIVRLLQVSRRFVVEALRFHRLIAVRSRLLAALALCLVGLLEEALRFCKGALDQRLIDAMADNVEEARVAARGAYLGRRFL